MTDVLGSIRGEFRRTKALADAAMVQLSDGELVQPGPGGGNSVVVVAWHVGGNLASRFTDFLTSDGEKPWRDRESEFERREPTRQELTDHWERGWGVLFQALSELEGAHLGRTVTIRGTELLVHEALHRALAHVSYHVGEIVYAAKALRGTDWEYLSVPPGGTDAYNRNPTSERADAHAARLERESGGG